MKEFRNLVILACLAMVCTGVFAQDGCKVLLPNLQGTYTGKCKDGLANGKGIAVGADRYEGKFLKGYPDGPGIYMYANGDVYKGNWKHGLRHGEGSLTVHLANRDSVVAGIWNEDNYKGPKPKKPEVTFSTGVDRYSFQNNGGQRNRILIDIFQNGNRNLNISNLTTWSSSGFDVKVSPSFGFDEVKFPVSVKIQYTTLNKLKTMPQSVKFEFTISEPGDWLLTLQN